MTGFSFLRLCYTKRLHLAILGGLGNVGVWVDRMEGSSIKIINFINFRNLFSGYQNKIGKKTCIGIFTIFIIAETSPFNVCFEVIVKINN